VPGDDTDYTTLIQSDLVYCSPHIRDSKDQPVDVRFRLGAEESRIVLDPGQVVMVSHWMLRTMDRQAKSSESAKYTLVAFVDPGKHRVSCDVSARWGSQGGRRTALRTGELAFDVTGADLARE
jgi:hypothetical protein